MVDKNAHIPGNNSGQTSQRNTLGMPDKRINSWENVGRVDQSVQIKVNSFPCTDTPVKGLNLPKQPKRVAWSHDLSVVNI